MQPSLFALQLGMVIAVIVLIGAWTLRYTLRATRTGAEPIIEASFRKLQKGWFQVHIAIANRAPYGLIVDELRRVRPRSARLMAPIKSVSTRKGDFQVWSHPGTDKATTSIPLDLVLGPHEASSSVSRNAEGQVTAWLFLPEETNPLAVTVELAVLDRAGPLRRYRVTARREGRR